MGSSRRPGPLCQAARPVMVNDGTSCRTPSQRPGSVCASRGDGIGEYARRIANVKDAFLLGVNKYAYPETVARLGSDARLIIDSLWPGFVQALRVYAWSIGIGAVAFGVAGAILGEGVGALPGAAIGAQLGSDVATAILFVYGVGFLVEFVLAHLDEANAHFGRGCDLAWRAPGDHPPLEPAAEEFGRAIAAVFSLILEAAVAWLIKKGLKTGMDELNKTKAGRVLGAYAKVEYWRRKLGVTDAPIPRRGIATTIEFFEDQVRKGNLRPMDEAKLQGYWKAMDFSRQVTVRTLEPGKELVGYRGPDSQFGFFYTERGTYLDRLGVDHVTLQQLPDGVPGPPTPVARGFVRYRVKQSVEVLESTASGVRAWDTNRPVAGGGIQYFIPRAWEILEVIQEGAPKK